MSNNIETKGVLYWRLIMLIEDLARLQVELVFAALNVEATDLTLFLKGIKFLMTQKYMMNQIELKKDEIRELAKSVVAELESESTRKNIDSQFMLQETNEEKNALFFVFVRLMPLLKNVEILKDQFKLFWLTAEKMENSLNADILPRFPNYGNVKERKLLIEKMEFDINSLRELGKSLLD